jgi:DNA-binding MarR family transcriptional regulator
MKRDERIRIGFLIHDVSRLRRTAFDQHVKPLGITRSQWWVLSGISRHYQQGITQTDLARVLELGKVALGGLVDRLERRGYVERQRDPYDRRINHLILTPKGREILRKMAEVGTRMNSKIMKGINMEHQYLLGELLRTMKDNLLDMGSVPGLRGRPRSKQMADEARGAPRDKFITKINRKGTLELGTAEVKATLN